MTVRRTARNAGEETVRGVSRPPGPIVNVAGTRALTAPRAGWLRGLWVVVRLTGGGVVLLEEPPHPPATRKTTTTGRTTPCRLTNPSIRTDIEGNR
jgi:hypothetical protein